jgi:hypothetical protein
MLLLKIVTQEPDEGNYRKSIEELAAFNKNCRRLRKSKKAKVNRSSSDEELSKGNV